MLSFKLLDRFTRLSRPTTAALSRFSSSAATSSAPAVSQQSRTEKSENDSQFETPSSDNFDASDVAEKERRRMTAFRNEQEEHFAPFRFVYPEFLPDPNIKFRNRIREKLERMDMLKRRSNLDIPEFYVGSILSVTVSDRNAPGKLNTFVGICTERAGNGLRSTFNLRNVVEGHGIEINYDLYNPTIVNITCLRLEKRLDENLRYLRDAPAEYSTVPFDMVPELRSADAPVPINPIKIKLNPRPWIAKWHLWELKGVEDLMPTLEDWQLKKFKLTETHEGRATLKYDLMKTYRDTIPAEDQTEIYSDVHQQLAKLTASLRKQKKKRTFVKPLKAA